MEARQGLCCTGKAHDILNLAAIRSAWPGTDVSLIASFGGEGDHGRSWAFASDQWTAEGGPVNYETHGEPYNAKEDYFQSYIKGKQVNDNQGKFTAMFDGTHGWFWRNRRNHDVA